MCLEKSVYVRKSLKSEKDLSKQKQDETIICLNKNNMDI